MSATAFKAGNVTMTTGGFPLRREESVAEENGERLHIVTWEVAIPVPPKSLRLAIFSYTILQSRMRDGECVAAIEELERSIKRGSYSLAPLNAIWNPEASAMTKYSNHLECAEAIAAYLVRNVPAPWRLIEVLVKVQHDIEMVTAELIYYPPAPGTKKKWFGIEDGLEDVEFGNCFVELAKLTSTSERGLFKRCKFMLEPDGKYKTEYEY